MSVFIIKCAYLCTQKTGYMNKLDIAICRFEHDKYGVHTDVDVVDVDSFRDFLWEHPVYSTDYYSVFLVLGGNERIEVNGVPADASPGMIICSRPGEIWKWEENSRITGTYLYWTETFLNTFFNDPNFIERFTYLNASRETSFLYPDRKMFREVLALLLRMRNEIETGFAANINNCNDDSSHMLRALVYETLMLLDRIERIPVKDKSKGALERSYIMEFQRLVRENAHREHSVEYYADRLFITSNYLNKIVKAGLGVSTKKYLIAALIDEAKRLLQYTDKPINDIADALNFDPVYFIKLFRQETGITPLRFRKDLENSRVQKHKRDNRI